MLFRAMRQFPAAASRAIDATKTYVDTAVTGLATDLLAAIEQVTETETSFTPTMAFATEGDAAWTLTSAEAVSVKHGSIVLVEFDFQFNVTHTTASGALRLGNMPITADATSRGGGWIRFKPGTINPPSTAIDIYPLVVAGQSYVQLYYHDYNGGSTVIDASHVTSGGASAALEFGVIYRV